MKKYANLVVGSDVEPFEVVARTAKTLTLRRVKAERDPSWKQERVPGGFAGHCVNQSEQRWFYSADEEAPMVKAYLRKDGRYWSRYGRHFLSDEPVRFYDYNF